MAETEFFIKDKTILEAIMVHASGAKKMKPLSKIIYAADKIEPTRGYDSSALINAMMVDLDSGFKEVLQANKDFLESQGKEISNPLSVACFKTYLK